VLLHSPARRDAHSAPLIRVGVEPFEPLTDRPWVIWWDNETRDAVFYDLRNARDVRPDHNCAAGHGFE
jgi:hypothetical protein